MIRRMTAAIDDVARGHSTLDDVRRALDGEEITFGVSRPDALTLLDVRYDWLEFTPYDGNSIDIRKKEGIFSCDLRRDFYKSL